ncbi:hypothetical protein ACFU99_00650 [Streptomyces sp. NPDC057654]|uniref:hypothetical protein n=1 Tax=Streptomyces sp. NPDC057654 TaxID=3346196 RepID=UPI0036A1A9B0
MSRPSKLPTGSELITGLALGKWKNHKEIAEEFQVTISAVSHRLAPFMEPKLSFSELMPWRVARKHQTSSIVRNLRLHLRAKLRPHTLSAKDETSHQQWIDSLQDRLASYDPVVGWSYVERLPMHENFVAVMPDDNSLAPEIIDLYRM